MVSTSICSEFLPIDHNSTSNGLLWAAPLRSQLVCIHSLISTSRYLIWSPPLYAQNACPLITSQYPPLISELAFTNSLISHGHGLLWCTPQYTQNSGLPGNWLCSWFSNFWISWFLVDSWLTWFRSFPRVCTSSNMNINVRQHYLL